MENRQTDESASLYDSEKWLKNVIVSENTSMSENKTVSTEEWTNRQITLTIVLGLITLTTILGNSFVLYIFITAKRKLRSATHLLLANMAVADLFVGIGVMPFLASMSILDMKWIWGDLMCFCFDYMHFFLCAASMCSMIGVSLERYIGVKYPLKHKQIMTRTRVVLLIITIWATAISMTSAPLTYWPKPMSQIRYVCYINLRTELMFFMCIFVYWIPISLTLIMYYLIYRNAMRSFSYSANFGKSKMNSSRDLSKPFGQTGLNDKKGGSKSENETLTAATLKQTRLTKTIAWITGLMIVFYGPTFILFTLVAFQSPLFSFELLFLFGWIRYSCSTVNPFLYALAVPGYRQEIRERLFAVGNINYNEAQISCDTTTDASDSNTLINILEQNTTADLSGKPLDQYCTQCGKLLRNVTKKDVTCSNCDRKVLGTSWILPSEWGTPHYFMCPECPTIRYFDGNQSCFCQNCSHRFQPIDQGLGEIKYSALQIPNSRKNPSPNIRIGGIDKENEIFRVNTDKNKSGDLKSRSNQRIQVTPLANGAPVSNHRANGPAFGIREHEIKFKHANENSDKLLKLNGNDSEQRTKVIKRLRQSIVPLMERRSRLVTMTHKVPSTNTKVAESEDAIWDQELDDIVNQLQLTLDLLNEQDLGHNHANIN